MAVIPTSNVIAGVAGVGSPIRIAGAPVDGTSGTGAGKAPTGAQCINTTAGTLFVNSGSQSSPLWAAQA